MNINQDIMNIHNPEVEPLVEIAIMKEELKNARQQRNEALDALRQIYNNCGNESDEVICERVLMKYDFWDE